MKKTILSIPVILGLLPLAGSAMAADLGGGPYRPPAIEENVSDPPLAPIWNGLYWGASLGYGWGESDHFYNRNGNHGVAQQDLRGGVGSLTLGYNKEISQGVLIGVEGDLGIMDLTADDKVIFDGHVWKSRFGSFWGTIRGRVGFLWDRTLIYGTGGWAFMDVDEVGIGDAAGQTAQNRDFRSGWVAGGGIEHALWPGVTGKVEYLHMDFGRYDGFSENREDFYFDNKVDLVRTGLNFKF